MRHFCALILLLTLLASPAHAGEGLAMHGTPKYGPGYAHFDYVNPNAPKGGTLKQSAIGTFDSINPFPIKGKAALGLGLVHDKLMERAWNEPFTLYPLIAEKAEVPADRSAITFTLDARAKFQDGSPITAEDVLFSYQTLRDHGRPNMRRVYKIVMKAEILAPRQIRFILGPDRNRETIMILAMMPVLSKNWWGGRDFESTTLDIPVASGPYRVTKVDPGRRVIYERMRDHWAQNLPPRIGHNNFDTMTVDYFRDETVALEAFKKGLINLRREYDPTKWAKDYQSLDRRKFTRHTITHRRPERAMGLIFNTRRAPFDDIDIRRALTHALDFEWINKNIYFGQMKRINSVFPNSDLARTLGRANPVLPRSDTPEARRKNMAEADQLLQQAGWIVKNGQRVNAKTGAPFTFEILIGLAEDEKIAVAFARALKRLGITAQIRSVDQANYRDRMNTYDFDMTVNFWLSSLSPGTEQALYWGCQAAQENGRFNYAGLCNGAVEKLIKEIPDVKTYDDLVTAARALDSYIMEENIFIPLGYVGADWIAADSALTPPQTEPLVPLYGTILETWWDKGAQKPLSVAPGP